MRRVEFMKEKKQPGETNFALCRRLAYLAKLANVKEVSGNDLLMVRFTACCDDEALQRDIFKLKGLTWDSLIEAVNTHEAASRMDTVTLTRDKLFKMNISNTGSSATSSSAPLRTPAVTSAPSPFAQNARGQDQKAPEWIQDINKERSKLVDGIRSNREKRKNDEGDRAPRSRSKNKDHMICHRCKCTGHYAADCTAPAPAPRSASKEPPRGGDRGPGGRQETGTGGHQWTGTGGHQGTGCLPGMEIEGQHLTDQGIPARVALRDTTTTALCITTMTARVTRKRMKAKCSFLGYPSRTC